MHEDHEVSPLPPSGILARSMKITLRVGWVGSDPFGWVEWKQAVYSAVCAWDIEDCRVTLTERVIL